MGQQLTLLIPVTLHEACENGDIRTVEKFILQGADIEQATSSGWTALHFASKTGHTDIVELLLLHRANTKALCSNDNFTEDGATPFYIACQNGHTRTTQCLISNDATVLEVQCQGSTPLYSASMHGQTETVEFLIKYGADMMVTNNDGLTPLHVACQNGHTETVECFLKHGISYQMYLIECKCDTPMHMACYKDSVDVIDKLIQYGARIDVKSVSTGTTPLHIACSFGHFKTVQHLLECGADINATENNGYTPLHSACLSGNTNVVKHLIQQGADLHVLARNGASCLHCAALSGNLETVKMIILNMVNIHSNAKLELNNYASEELNSGLAIQLRSLLQDEKQQGEWTALDVAKKMNHSEVAEMLNSTTRKHLQAHILRGTITALCGIISVRDCKFLVRRLLVDDVTIDDIAHEYSNSREQCYRMMQAWRKKAGSKANVYVLMKTMRRDTTLTRCSEALIEYHRGELEKFLDGPEKYMQSLEQTPAANMSTFSEAIHGASLAISYHMAEWTALDVKKMNDSEVAELLTSMTNKHVQDHILQGTIRTLCRHISVNDCKFLARDLRVDDVTIDDITCDFKSREQCYRMIQAWRIKAGSKANVYVLMETMRRDSNLTACSEALIKYYRKELVQFFDDPEKYMQILEQTPANMETSSEAILVNGASLSISDHMVNGNLSDAASSNTFVCGPMNSQLKLGKTSGLCTMSISIDKDNMDIIRAMMKDDKVCLEIKENQENTYENLDNM